LLILGVDMLYVRTILYSAISLVVLFVFTKLIGKRQISNLSLFDYINGMVIGSIAAEMAIGIDENIWVGVVAMTFYGVSVYVMDVIDRKSIRARRFFSGTPTVLFKNGKFLKNNFKRAQLSISEFQEMCRIAGYFDISRIALAQLEPSGKLSVLPKSEEEPLTVAVLTNKITPAFAPISVIYDGVILDTNLKHAGKNETWLRRALERAHYSLSDIFLATVDGEGELTLYPASDHLR